MAKLEFKLKQHTPIIHFQPNQIGATLRLSDFKPRLDKYLIKNCNYSPPIRYKVDISIIKEDQTRSSILKNNNDANRESSGLYFGNQGNSKPKQLIHDDMIELKFNTYFDDDLERKIREQLPIMLALENFGTRNNKGFGSLYEDGKTVEEFQNALKNNVKSKIYYWEKDYRKMRDILFSIKTFYTLLKAGINLRWKNENGTIFNTYYKSLLYLYLENNPAIKYSWEKRKIKDELNWFFGRSKSSHLTAAREPKFARALLGVGNNQQWGVGRDKRNLDIGFQTSIDRIPSPVLFKVFTYNKNGIKKARVYFWTYDYYHKVLGKEFTLTGDSKTFSLKAPEYFDIHDFVEDVVNNKLPGLSINNNNGNAAEGIIKATDKEILFLKNNVKPL